MKLKKLIDEKSINFLPLATANTVIRPKVHPMHVLTVRSRGTIIDANHATPATLLHIFTGNQ